MQRYLRLNHHSQLFCDIFQNPNGARAKELADARNEILGLQKEVRQLSKKKKKILTNVIFSLFSSFFTLLRAKGFRIQIEGLNISKSVLEKDIERRTKEQEKLHQKLVALETRTRDLESEKKVRELILEYFLSSPLNGIHIRFIRN